METIELIHQRIARERGRRVVSCWTAAAVLLMGFYHAAPAGLYLVGLQPADIQPDHVARWTFFCFFLSAIHIAYALYVYQVLDWSAVYVIAMLQLGVAVVFAILCGALYVDQGSGMVSRFLQLPRELSGNATLWCATTMCAAGLFSYVAWHEACRWRNVTRPTGQH